MLKSRIIHDILKTGCKQVNSINDFWKVNALKLLANKK